MDLAPVKAALWNSLPLLPFLGKAILVYVGCRFLFWCGRSWYRTFYNGGAGIGGRRSGYGKRGVK